MMTMVTTAVLVLGSIYALSGALWVLHTFVSVLSFGADAGARLVRASDAMPEMRKSFFDSTLFLAWLKWGQVFLFGSVLVALFA